MIGMHEFSYFALSRLRMGTDGHGVTTLIGGHGCPLDCRYCLNPQCKSASFIGHLDRETLYQKLRIDSLYFEATGGGVTFGGGEPLLQAAFIADFIEYTAKKGEAWQFCLETSLAVPAESLCLLHDKIHRYIVDIKDFDDAVYRAYTGQSSRDMRENLATLAARCPERVHVRVPLIPHYNTEAHCARSCALLHEMGLHDIECFSYRVRP